MKETALLCQNSTSNSLILIDELGRATSNEDGVAIAWAISEFLLVKRAISFFVTHYPQMSKLAKIYPNVQNQHLGAHWKEGDDVVYEFKVLPGSCELANDYGVDMARVCGWPDDVVQEARRLYVEVEQNLPDETLCRRNDINPDMDLAGVMKKAEDALHDLAKHLVALKESNSRLRDDALRSYLQVRRIQIFS